MSKILIVDDNLNNLYLEHFLLKKNGHDISEARNGEQAVMMAKSDSFDLILMDIQMPIMDGLEATRQIKESTQNPPVIIAVTAKAMSGDRDEILAAGCDGYIEKPINPFRFPDMVESYLEK